MSARSEDRRIGGDWRDSDSHWETVDPGRISTAGVKDPEAVKHYQRDPHRRFDSGSGDGPVCVVRNSHGMWARDGAHRIEAARREGRPVQVRVIDQGAER